MMVDFFFYAFLVALLLAWAFWFEVAILGNSRKKIRADVEAEFLDKVRLKIDLETGGKALLLTDCTLQHLLNVQRHYDDGIRFKGPIENQAYHFRIVKEGE